MISEEKLNELVNQGKEIGATDLIVVLDTSIDEYYPIYVFKNQRIKSAIEKDRRANKDTVIEIYSLKKYKC